MNDDALLSRLRELSLVELDALVRGGSDEEIAVLARQFASDMNHALCEARDRVEQLRVKSPASLFVFLGSASETLALEQGRIVAEQSKETMRGAADDLRRAALILQAAALVVPKLFEVERRIGAR